VQVAETKPFGLWDSVDQPRRIPAARWLGVAGCIDQEIWGAGGHLSELMGACCSKEADPAARDHVKDLHEHGNQEAKTPQQNAENGSPKRRRPQMDSSLRASKYRAKSSGTGSRNTSGKGSVGSGVGRVHRAADTKENRIGDETVASELKISTTATLNSEDPRMGFSYGDILTKTNLGHVRKGSDAKTGKTVIIKVSILEGKTVEDPREEIRIMQLLENCWSQDADRKGNSRCHPNIVGLLGAFEIRPRVIVVQEFVNGGDAFDFLTENVRVPEDETKHLMRGVVDALNFMHSNGICHLDVSLENILITRDRKQMKLCDFGAARELIRDGEGKLLKYPVKYGHPGKRQYMAPEVYSHKSFWGTKADTFSLGVTLFMLLAGKPPFFKPNQTCAYFRFMRAHGVGPTLKHYGVELSENAVDLLNSMLQIEPTKRIDSRGVLDHKWFSKYADR